MKYLRIFKSKQSLISLAFILVIILILFFHGQLYNPIVLNLLPKDTLYIASQEIEMEQYKNNKYRYSICYPQNWETSLEYQDGSGIDLYIGHPDITIKVFALEKDKQKVDSTFFFDSKYNPNIDRRSSFEFDKRGIGGNLIYGKRGNFIILHAFFYDDFGIQYNFVSKTPKAFFDSHKSLLFDVARSLWPIAEWVF